MTILNASEARANLYRLIEQVAESHEPVLIAGKRRSAVLVAEEDWTAIQETMHLVSIPGMRKSIRDAMAEPLARSAKELRWRSRSTLKCPHAFETLLSEQACALRVSFRRSSS